MTHVFLAIGPHAWGKGSTQAAAKRKARERVHNPTGRKFTYRVIRIAEEAYIDQWGMSVMPAGHSFPNCDDCYVVVEGSCG